MAYDTLSVQIDVAEPRIQRDRIATLVTGGVDGRLQWDVENSTDTFTDPITFTTILNPLPNTPQWMTTVDGDYSRQRKADYDIAASADWVEHNIGIDGNVYLLGKGVNDPVTTLTSWEKNQPFWLSFFPFGAGDSFLQIAFECGGVGLEFYTGGEVLVYRAYTLESGGIQVGRGSIRNLEGQHGLAGQKRHSTGAQDNLQGQPCDVLILPWRTRDLLILSNRGGGFNFTFDDIDKDDLDPTITAAGPVRWKVPAPTQPCVLLAPVRFKQSGEIVSFTQKFWDVPASGASASCAVYWEWGHYDVEPAAVAQLCDTDGATPFVGDNSKTEAILKVSLSGNGKNTPFLYGAKAEFLPVIANTDASEAFVLDSFLKEIRLDVPDDNWGETLTLVAKEVPTLETYVTGARRQANRPILATLGNSPVFVGRTGDPDWKDDAVETHQEVIWKCYGPGRAHEKYQLRYPVPFDTMLFSDAIAYLATAPGYPDEEMDIEDFGVTLDSPSQASNGEWALLPEAGDRAKDWLDRLFENFAKNCIMGWYPSPATASGRRFRLRSPQSMGVTPVVTLYATGAEALAAGWPIEEVPYRIYNNFRELSPEPEANDLLVVGWDNRLERAITAYAQDIAAKDPTLAPSARPENWSGELGRVSLLNPAITTQGLANYALGVLRARLFAQLRPAEWDCQFLSNQNDGSPVWRGDVVLLSQHGLYRVRSLSGVFDVENVNRVNRPFHYTGEGVIG